MSSSSSSSSSSAGQLRVLSIQSHVVSGYVGNKAATFPLQLLGFDVDCINSVQFSNHTGYKSFKGAAVDGDGLLALFHGLQANGLDNYTHVLTGYIGNESFLRAVLTIVAQLRKKNPALVYVCDPVLGDDGRLYVPPSLVGIFSSAVVAAASIVTPNQFEAEQLTGMQIRSHEDAKRAALILHRKGCPTVVFTSAVYPASSSSSSNNDDNKILYVLGSEAARPQELIVISIRQLSTAFSGTGDLIAALILAHYTRTNGNLLETLRLAISAVQAVIARTITDNLPHPHCPCPELRLVQSKAAIESTVPTVNGSVIATKTTMQSLL